MKYESDKAYKVILELYHEKVGITQDTMNEITKAYIAIGMPQDMIEHYIRMMVSVMVDNSREKGYK